MSDLTSYWNTSHTDLMQLDNQPVRVDVLHTRLSKSTV